MVKKIGEILTELFQVDPNDIKHALEVQKRVGGYLGQILLKEGIITERQLLLALSKQLNIPIFYKENANSNFEPLYLNNQVNIDYLLKNWFIPFKIDSNENTLICLTNDPLNTTVQDYISRLTPLKLRIYLAEESLLQELIQHYRRESEKEYVNLEIEESVERLKEIASEAPVIKYLNQLLTTAVELRATDIHIEPMGLKFRIRLRVDGLLHDLEILDKSFYLALVSRIKLLAGLNIAEKRLPQDGKFSTRVASTPLDLRVSTIPLITGESVVLRLLYKERLSLSVSQLGLERDHERIFLDLISKPYGMLLLTGPTGSGKTTTLYTLLSILNKEEKKIVTVEDPVEYQLEGINQIQVKPEIGLTFANALRSILRHDPDIIMIGEIRDRETAEIAIHSALTGHLVLSTLHTNDAISAIFRLVEMGIEDYLINAAVIGVAAQRLVRKNCLFCSQVEESSKIMEKFSLEYLCRRFPELLNPNEPCDGRKILRGSGCPRCVHTGYLGRIGIFEIVEYDDFLKENFIKYKSLEQLRKISKERDHYRSMREDGFIKVLKGITTPEEVLRVT